MTIQHQWDAGFVMDAHETTAVLGLTATPWAEVVRATAQAGTASASGTASAGSGRLKR